MARRLVTTAARRARLAHCHHLAPWARAVDVVDAARDVVGLHGTDPTSVYLAAWARTDGLTPAALERALYADRTLLKILGMRRTMFVTSREVAAVIQSACTRMIAERERRRLVGWLAETAVAGDDPEAWLAEVEGKAVAALDAHGQATAAELTQDVPELGTQIPFGAGKTWQGSVGVSTRLLFLLAAEGRIIRGRPRGSWVSSLYRWAPMERWTGGGLTPLPEDEARTELVRRWIRAFGPGTEADLAWWTGWALRDVRRAVMTVTPVEVDLEGGRVGYMLAEDEAELEMPPATPREVATARGRGPSAAPVAQAVSAEGTAPVGVAEGFAATPGASGGVRTARLADDGGSWVALLPALDSTVMGWTQRDWYLGLHGAALFDRNGNAGPTIWLDGRIVGGWAQQASGSIPFRLLEDVGADAVRLVEAEAERVRAWLGDVRIVPRFRTPLETELTG